MSGFQIGELILISKPFAYVLDNVFRGERCDLCFKKQEGLKKCGKCSFAYYCNRLCQLEAWETHKMECKFIMQSKPLYPTPHIRLNALILMKLKKYGYDQSCEEVYGRKVTFRTLMSHADDVMLKHYQDVMDTVKDLTKFIGPSYIPPIFEYFEIYGKIVVNSFTISDDEFKGIGTGVYLGASVFDHSCHPDAEVVYNGINLSVRTVKNIPHRDISQIRISYIDELQWKDNRQNDLEEKYFFRCQCDRCLSSDHDNMMEKLLVSGVKAAPYMPKFTSELMRIAEMMECHATPSSIYEACVAQLRIQDKILADTHAYKIKVLECAFSACVESKQWNEAVSLGNRLVEPYRLLYGPYHPKSCTHLFQIGKIQLLLNLPSSSETLQKAEKAVKVSYGEAHSLYKDVLEKLNESKIMLLLSKATTTN